MKDKNSGKLYGRARRIEFIEKLAYFFAGLVAVVVVFFIISHQKGFEDDNKNFAYLREYMEAKGYYCEMIQSSGGSCTLKSDVSTSVFTRYEDGFEFIVKTDSYFLNIKHISTANDFIVFRTTANALVGYKSMNYTCKYDDSVVGKLRECVADDGTILDADAYIGVIEMAMQDVDSFIESSGYYKKELMEDYEWRKK